MHAFDCTAPYPSGKGAVCKTAMHQFDSDWRLFIDFKQSSIASIVVSRLRWIFTAGIFPVRAKSDKYFISDFRSYRTLFLQNTAQ